MRAMRRSGQELPQEEAWALLKQGSSGVLAVLGDGDYPYAVPLSYVLYRGKIYFHCARTGHKIDAIARHEKASFCVIAQDQHLPEKFTTLFRSVIVFGRARVLTEPEEIRPILTALGEKYSPGVPGLSEEVESSLHRVALIELTPEAVTGKEAVELTRERRK